MARTLSAARFFLARKMASPPAIASSMALHADRFRILSPRTSKDLCCGGPTRVSSDACYELQAGVATPAMPLLTSAGGLAEVVVRLPIEAAEARECAVEDLDTPAVSKNCFEALGAPDVIGTSYQARRRSTQHLFGQDDAFRRKTRRRARKAYIIRTTGDTTTVKEMDFWDRLLPVLQPPLRLDMPETLDLPHDLRPYQRDGIKFLLEHPSALLADEMGTGKTVMSLTALRILFRQGEVKTALIVCPSSVLSVWEDHIEKWAPDLRQTTTFVQGNVAERQVDWTKPAHVYISTYGLVRNDVEHLGGQRGRNRWLQDPFDLVLLDEIQKIKNPDSQQTRAAIQLNAQWRWGLSGTALETGLENLLSIFRFIKPGALSEGTIRLGAAATREAIRPYVLRRTKKEVLKELPPKIRQEIWLELGRDQRAAYEAALADGQERVRRVGVEGSEIAVRQSIFALIQSLKQICNFAPGSTNSPKLEALSDLVENIQTNGKKALVFSQYVSEGADKIAGALKRGSVEHVVLKGALGPAAREEAIRKFMQGPQVTCFVATLGTGGEGLNLQKASYVVHFDHWWNPARMWQAEDRAHRLGQEEPVTVYGFWMRDTIDERIHDLLEERGVLFDEVMGQLSDKDIESRISLKDWYSIVGVEPPQAKASETDLVQLTPEQFESLCTELFRKLGYHAWTTGQSKDGGVDVRGVKEGLGAQEVIIAQCKHWQRPVGVEVAREILGVVTSDKSVTRGYIVASGPITDGCRRFCNEHGSLACIDGNELREYLRRLDIKVDGLSADATG